MRKGNRYEGTDILWTGEGHSSVTSLSRKDFMERNSLRQENLEAKLSGVGGFLGTMIGFMVGGIPGAIIGGAIGGGLGGYAENGTEGAIVGAIGGGLGGGIGGGVATVVNTSMAASENNAKAYNEMASGIGTDNSTANIVGGISDTEMRRRAKLSDAKNNMTNVLSGASSESSTGPMVKKSLGNTDLSNTAIIGSTIL